MSLLRLILRSLRHHWRMNFAVACGVAVGTAVLTGALLVGDSMRGSLRHLALDRLGRVEHALITEQFFRADLAKEMTAVSERQGSAVTAVPVILLRGSLEKTGSLPAMRANQVNMIGCDEPFWQLGEGKPGRIPGPQEIVLNRVLAEQLGVTAGDEVGLRLPRPGAIPAESSLGQKGEQENLAVMQLRVSEVIAAEGLGRFGLRPSQRVPRNAYLSLAALQQLLRQTDRANAILVGRALQGDAEAERVLLETPAFHPLLEDYGIHVRKTRRGYLNITSDRMMLEPAADLAIQEALEKNLAAQAIQPALTYLANTIARGAREIPYSTITAVDFAAEPPLGPFLGPDGKPLAPLADGEIALNSWAAEDLDAKIGDSIRVTYFEPESTHGRVREKTAELRLAAIAALAGAADDRDFTPTVAGLTDKSSLDKWDPPFPFQRARIRPKDDRYWSAHHATPKAFVSLATGRQLWASRFGQTTSIRVRPAKSMSAEGLAADLKLDPAAMGFVFQPVRQQALDAAAGTTPFQFLFLAFSAFIIAAAVMLVALLFRLGIERRAAEAGLLFATGWRSRQVVGLFAGEGLIVAALGSALGMAGGIGYAALMVHGLRTWWLGAVSTPFLELYCTNSSLAIGYGSGLAIAFAAIVWSARRLSRVAPRRLLAGVCDAGDRPASRSADASRACTKPRPDRPRRKTWIPWGEIVWTLVLAASITAALTARVPGDMEVGVFFGSGVLVLGLSLTVLWRRLRRGATGTAVAVGRGNLLRMALRNAARNPGRSGLAIGLVASATFLIVAISAFRINPAQQAPRLDSGNGGFALVAESDQPIYRDLDTPEGRADLGFSAEDEALLAQCHIHALRVKPGDDASCLNLYRPRQPRLLGVPRSLVRRGGFAWAAARSGVENPWSALAPSSQQRETSQSGGKDAGVSKSSTHSPHPNFSPEGVGESATPMVLDKNTSNYSLNLWKGLGEVYETTDARGRPLRLEVAGLLSNSIFQGDLLVAEDALVRDNPEVSGYRFFLIEAPPETTADVQAALERTLGDFGFATETTAERMAGFLAVQNTYLSTFQSLGGLGLLLGTIGLAAVQWRGVLERRGELALLRATGFRRATLARLILWENLLLLLLGLSAGLLAALIAILPHLLGRGAAIPWNILAGILGLVLMVGIIAGMMAIRAVAAVPLLEALRTER